MSLSISTLSSTDANQHSAETSKPTISQQVKQLATSGETAQQIATSLSVPVSEVDSVLGSSSSSSTSQASALLSANQRLSVRA